MTRILVTGASGLLGVNLALAASGEHEVVGVLHSQSLRGAPFHTVQADLLDANAPIRLLDEAEPEWVVHCAALANLDACEQQPELARRLNAELPGHLATACAQRKVRFLHVSTDAVFDGQKGDYAEDDPPQPLGVYGRTKLQGERAVQAAFPEAIIVRTVFFGWSLNGQRSLAEKFYQHLASGEGMPGHTDRIFNPLMVTHLAEIILRMLAADLHGLYHAAAPDRLSKYEFGRAVAERFDLDPDLVISSRSDEAGLAATRAPNLTLNSAKLSAALGRPLPAIAEGIEAFYQQHASGYVERLRSLLSQPEGSPTAS